MAEPMAQAKALESGWTHGSTYNPTYGLTNSGGYDHVYAPAQPNPNTYLASSETLKFGLWSGAVFKINISTQVSNAREDRADP